MANEWKRVSRRRRCPVCEKPDWCLYTGDDSAPTAVICARVESEKQAGEGGWLHKLRDDGPLWAPWKRTVHVAAKKLQPEVADIEKLAAEAQAAIGSGSPIADLRRFADLADSLGLSFDSLRSFGIGWSKMHKAWTFPMKNARGKVTGIRLRYPNGKKLSVRGGKEGLFLPDIQPAGRLLICEGPTDAAALLDLGFRAIGRPSCTGGVKHICELAKRLKPAEVVIVADDDGPGQRGAGNLASTLLAYVPRYGVITPPDNINDAREWKRSGATTEDVEAVIEAAPTKTLRIKALSK